MMRRMNTSKRVLGLGIAVLFATSLGGFGQTVQQVLLGGARYHQDNSSFVGYPFAKGDLSYGATYEYEDQNALWQLGVDVTPKFKSPSAEDYAVTPQLNLLLKDQIFRGGLGILSTYTRDNAGKGDWMDLYWQFILGVEIPLPGRLVASANAYYVFDKWDNLNSFDFKDVEYGVSLGYKF